MAEPLQENPSTDVQVDDESSEILSHGSSASPEPETESKRETYPDPEAQSMVIESLRSQIQDLFSQVTQLNSKLVSSYDRVSVLEDQLHDSSNGLRSASVKISQLELERSQHLSALNSGLLVERTHVTAELTRVMEKATEEAARRGKAESARAQIEKELDDLSAGLFGQANTMVAEARLARAASERKVEETERALKGAEEAIANMQLHMQALDEEKEEALRQVEEMRVTVGKGKWTSRDSSTLVTVPRHILNCTSQYQDFLGFIAHIRELRQKSPILPLITTVNHSWLARLQLEDSDPTVRLELSSSINWMNRRSVLLAIQQGQLDIEPVPSETFLQEHAAAQSGISGLGTGSSIICGLCGAFIMNDSKSSAGMFQRQLALPTNAWSTSLFTSRQTSRSATPLQSPGIPKPTTIYIFKLAADPYGTPQPGRSRPMYPLCTSGWCLNRLRTACNLWAFVRTSIMERLWEEANLVASRRTSTGEAPSQSESEKQQEEPAPPPPALRGRFGKLWERASSLGAGVVEKVSTTGPEKDRKNEEDARKLPSPPPEPEETPPKRFVPPLPPTRTQAVVPPQLPPRNQSRIETTAPPVEEATPPRQDSILFEHDQHDHPQPVESSPVQSTPPIKPSELEKLESVADALKPPVPPPRASRHPPADSVRPGTPSAIPLPDSRPSTPTPTTTAERRRSIPSTPTKLDSGRSSSPMPGLAGTPPPIPRRAPARVRPVSVSIRPSTPLNQPPLNPPEGSKDLGVDLPTTVNESAKPVEEAVPPAVAEVISRPDVIKPIFTEVEPRQPDAGVTRTAEASDPIALTEGPATSPVDDVSRTVGDNSGLINDQNLVGDKSWEDKTWREVVRLREEMFYARMGIIR